MQNSKSDREALLSLFEINGFPVKVEHGLFFIRRDVWDDCMEVLTMEQAHKYWSATASQDRLMECYEIWISKGKPIRRRYLDG